MIWWIDEILVVQREVNAPWHVEEPFSKVKNKMMYDHPHYYFPIRDSIQGALYWTRRSFSDKVKKIKHFNNVMVVAKKEDERKIRY